MSYDTDYFNQEEIDFLNFIAKATRSNQLFLTNAVQLNMVKLRPLYDWFESKLTVISLTVNLFQFNVWLILEMYSANTPSN